MSDTTFGFLPWMRKGIVSKITQVDGSSTSTNERGEVEVKVTLRGNLSSGTTTTDTITNTVQLYGPGDVLGVDQSVVVRTEPANGSFNFEDNYLAYIEFYEEDFLWRYTPAISDSSDKLRPWLALIVLKDDEYTVTAPAGDGLPVSINITGTIGNIFHNPVEHWAWGHVCVTSPNGGSATTPTSADYIAGLLSDLPTQPDIAVGRLLCPRRLAPNTSYTAFVIPAFETGRQAGLASDPYPALASVPSLQASWSLSGGPTQFPVYYQWRFGTGSQGDFESLARALKPRLMDPSLGGRPMDISNSGIGLNSLFTGSLPTSVTMEGSLMPSTFSPAAAKTASSTDAYTLGLKTILNLGSTLKDPSFTSTSFINPYIYPSPPTVDQDPIVTPPIYGQWHANDQTVDTGSPMWLQQLNLDPRYRAAAGLGAQTIRNNKQAYLQIAWEEIGEVLLVNNKIIKLRAAVEASQRIFQKHFLGNATRASTAVDTIANDFAQIGGLSFKKININDAFYALPATGPTPSTYIDTSGGHNISALNATSYSNITSASVNGGFRKITRNRSFVVSRANSGGAGTPVNSNLVANINQGTTVVAARVFAMPSGSPTIMTASSYASYAEGLNSGNGGAFASANTATWTQAYVSGTGSSYDEFRALIGHYTTLQNANEIHLVQMYLTTSGLIPGFINKVESSLTPSTTITARIAPQIELEVPTGSPPTLDLNKLIMAYPIIDEPMFQELVNISSEYLLPNLEQYPNNMVTVLETNTRFIESYMAGLNHEFARELLWQEYPTDQRGSYFRRFWDINDTVDFATTSSFMYDIDPMHLWGSYFTGQDLGKNNYTTRHSTVTSQFLVLLIRGDLLKKYPNALIYAQKASATPTSPPHGIDAPTSLLDGFGNPDPTIVKLPIFKASLQPDIVLLGFDLTRAQALGTNTSGDTGWFFVFRERPGQMRFGLEEPSGSSTTFSSWDELDWGIYGSSPTTVNISGVSPTQTSTDPVPWGGNAANMAHILYRDPVMVAIHAESMLV